MARGVFYKCDVCDHVKFIEIGVRTYENVSDEYLVNRFNTLPGGWVKMQVPYVEESVNWHEIMHVCSVECAKLLLESRKEAEETGQEVGE